MDSETIEVREGEGFDLEAVERYMRGRIEDLPEGELEIRQFPSGASNLTYLLKVADWEGVLRRPPFGPVPPKAHDMLGITRSGELQNLLLERSHFLFQQLVIFHQREVLSAIAANYRPLFEFFSAIRAFHSMLYLQYLVVFPPMCSLSRLIVSYGHLRSQVDTRHWRWVARYGRRGYRNQATLASELDRPSFRAHLL